MDPVHKSSPKAASWDYSVDVEEENSDLRYDAAHVAKNLAFTVKGISISDKLTSNANLVFLNVTTLEGDRFCIELSERGYRIIGGDYDDVSLDRQQFFESLNSLLETVSPLYTCAFGEALITKLHDVKRERDNIVIIVLNGMTDQLKSLFCRKVQSRLEKILSQLIEFETLYNIIEKLEVSHEQTDSIVLFSY